MKIAVTEQLSAEFVAALLAEVCESPIIAHWANPDEDAQGEYREYSADGKLTAARIRADIEPLPGHTVQQTINGETLSLGIKRLIEGTAETNLHAEAVGVVVIAVVADDPSDIDQETLDTIVQVGLYNDLMYA
jgi:hypothetical protein